MVLYRGNSPVSGEEGLGKQRHNRGYISHGLKRMTIISIFSFLPFQFSYRLHS